MADLLVPVSKSEAEKLPHNCPPAQETRTEWHEHQGIWIQHGEPVRPRRLAAGVAW
jgi:hypothetical protein